MDRFDKHLSVRVARDRADILAAHRLRYDVFIAELGGDGPLVDHVARTEQDRFDPHFDQIVLIDSRRDAETYDHVVGVYRVMRGDQAAAAGQFYSEDEYDLSVLKGSGRKLLELGRSCVHRDYRGGPAMFQLWQGLADYVAEHDIEVLFGVASFHGTDPDAIAEPLSLLHHRHLAPPDLRVRTRAEFFVPMDRVAEGDIDRVRAIREIPALIKAYLKLGGYVGEGAFIDHPFNTIDVCLVMDTTRMSRMARDRYGKAGA